MKEIKFIYEKRSLFCMQRVHIVVHGSVQGVFFRHYTRKTALSLGLKGYVRNMFDGTVEVVDLAVISELLNLDPAEIKATGTEAREAETAKDEQEVQ